MNSVLFRTLRGVSGLLSLPLALIVTIALKLCMPGRKVRIVVMDPRYFGHQSLEPEVFWNDWQASKETGSGDVWFCCLGKRSAAANPYLWDHTRDKFPTVPSWIVTRLAPWLGRLKFSNILLTEASIYRLNFLANRPSTLPSASTFVERRKEILSNLKDPKRPYVVFTIRDLNVSYDRDDPRNRDIKEFIPAMRALTARGFNVIRLTSKTSYPMTNDDGHILDWQVLVDGCEADELVLLSQAAFVVSTTTGGDCLALAYRRPVLYIDSARFYLVFLATELATFQVPLMIDNNSGERLRLEELLARDLGWVNDSRLFKKAEVSIVNSTPPELERYVIEFAETLSQQISESNEDLQDSWRRILLSVYNDEVTTRHGDIRARMLPTSLAAFV